MPYLKFPTSAQGLGNRSIEGGLILPLDVSLPGDFYLGLTTRFAAMRNFDEPGYSPQFANSISLLREIYGKLFGFVEFYSEVTTQRNTGWLGTFDTGLYYTFTPNMQLNAGVNIGVTGAADQWNPFVGLAWRF